MAKRMHAIQAYSPRIKLSTPLDIEYVSEFIAGRSSLNMGDVKNVFREIREALLHYFSVGQSVQMDDVGIFRPVIARDGSLRINFKADRKLIRKLNDAETNLNIKCKDMIGKTDADYIARWNDEHPDDPVED